MPRCLGKKSSFKHQASFSVNYIFFVIDAVAHCINLSAIKIVLIIMAFILSHIVIHSSFNPAYVKFSKVKNLRWFLEEKFPVFEDWLSTVLINYITSLVNKIAIRVDQLSIQIVGVLALIIFKYNLFRLVFFLEATNNVLYAVFLPCIIIKHWHIIFRLQQLLFEDAYLPIVIYNIAIIILKEA